MPLPDDSSDSSSFRIALALLALVVLALGLRVYEMDVESAWGDEALTLRHLPAPSIGEYWDRVFTEDYRLRLAPAYYLLQYLWTLPASEANVLTAARWLSVTLSIASLLVLVVLGKRLGGGGLGLLAGLFFALSLVQVYYAQEVRFYALLVLLSLVSMLGFVRGVAGEGRRWWVLHMLANTALLLTHTFSVPLFAAQGFFLLLEARRDFRRLVIWTSAHLGLGGLLGVWLLFLNYDIAHQSEAFNDALPGLYEAAMTLLIFAGGRFSGEDPAPYMPMGFSFDKFLGVLFLVALCVTAYGALRPARADGAWDRPRTARLLLCWLGVSLVFLFVVSHAWKPIFFYRYALYAACAVPLVFAFAVTAIPKRSLRVTAVVLLSAMFLYQNLALERPMRADYESMARDIADDPADDIRIYAIKHFNSLGADYATGPHDPRMITYLGYGELLADTAAVVEEGAVVWAVFHHWSRVDYYGARMRDAELVVKEYVYGGMPPLYATRVSGE